jgi:acetaldehyde dehydrogenase / alcohol dehydrogenase
MTGILKEIDTMVQRAQKALEVMKSFTQEQVDAITEAMAAAGLAAGDKLAEMAVHRAWRV